MGLPACGHAARPKPAPVTTGHCPALLSAGLHPGTGLSLSPHTPGLVSQYKAGQRPGMTVTVSAPKLPETP